MNDERIKWLRNELICGYRVQRTPSEDRTKHLPRRQQHQESEPAGKSEITEFDLEKQRAMLLAQLKEPESE